MIATGSSNLLVGRAPHNRDVSAALQRPIAPYPELPLVSTPTHTANVQTSLKLKKNRVMKNTVPTGLNRVVGKSRRRCVVQRSFGRTPTSGRITVEVGALTSVLLWALHNLGFLALGLSPEDFTSRLQDLSERRRSQARHLESHQRKSPESEGHSPPRNLPSPAHHQLGLPVPVDDNVFFTMNNEEVESTAVDPSATATSGSKVPKRLIDSFDDEDSHDHAPKTGSLRDDEDLDADDAEVGRVLGLGVVEAEPPEDGRPDVRAGKKRSQEDAFPSSFQDEDLDGHVVSAEHAVNIGEPQSTSTSKVGSKASEREFSLASVFSNHCLF